MPFPHNLLPLSGRAAVPHHQRNRAMIQPYGRLFPRLHNAQKIAPAPDIMAFALHILSGLFAFLPAKLPLMPLDPANLADSKEPHILETHPTRCGNMDVAGRWINAQVDVFDVFELYIHPNPSNVEHGVHQYSRCALMIENKRSTSSSALRMS